MPSVARNTLYLTSAYVGQKILSFVYFTLLARFLGAELIGKYTFALAFTTIFSIITDLGLTPVLIREVARTKEKAQDLLRTVLGIKLMLGGAAYGAVLAAAYFLGHPPLTIQLIAIAGAVMLFDAFNLTCYGVLRGLQNLRYESVGMVIGQGITLVLGGAAIVLHLPIHAFLATLAFGSFWNVIFSARALFRAGISPSVRFNRASAVNMLRTAIPFGLSGIFVRVYSYIDTVLLQHIRGDIEVGWYSVPYKITYAFQFLPLALSAALYPALASAWKTDRDRLRLIFARAFRYSIFLVLPIVFGIAALAPEIILTIYGRQFENSILPLKISIFGLVFMFLYFPVGALLNATDRQKVNTVFMGFTMVANIVLNIFLIPHFGAVGASIATLFTNAFLWLGTLIVALRIIKLPSRIFSGAIKSLIAASAMMVVVLQLKHMMPWPFSIVAGGVVYGACLYAFRAITRDDFSEFVKLFRKPPFSVSRDLSNRG